MKAHNGSNPNAEHRQRLKRRFLDGGLHGFEPHNALELLLFYAIPRADVNKLSHALIERFGSISGVFDASAEELTTVNGVSTHTAVLLKLIPAMSALYRIDRSGADFSVTDIDGACAFLREYFSAETVERSVLLIFDDNGALTGIRELSQGNGVAAQIIPRKIAELTLAARGRKIILAHNHCTADTAPSASDIRITDELRRVLSAIDVELVEHIIVSRSGAALPLISYAKADPETAKIYYGR